MGWRTLCPIFGVTALVPLTSWLAAPEPSPGREDRSGAVSEPPAGGTPRVGSTSCSGRGCHGKVAPAGTEGSEFNTWARLDPHATAFLVLFDCRSESIQRNLLGSRPGEEFVPAYRDALCKSCHGDADATAAVLAIGEVDCADAGGLSPAIGTSGVGCEDCHGPAREWLDEHYREGWPDRFPEASASMQPLRATADRAGVCLRCHVGDGLGREVNHDLIAAGHPRLNFELSSSLDRLPRHWDASITDGKRKDEGLPPRSSAREWAVGQAETLRATLSLLAERADPPSGQERNPPWPEFAEYACFSCHHALVDEGLHYSRGAAVPGSLSWASWAMPMARTLLEREAPGLVDRLDGVASLMAQPLPDGEEVARAAGRLSSELGSWASGIDDEGFDSGSLRELLSAISSDPARLEGLMENWDAAAQLYLACRAQIRAEAEELLGRGGASEEDLTAIRSRFEALEHARAALEFPERDLDSPGSPNEPNPWASDPRPAVEALRTLLDAIASGG
ncbi:hypothetical protein [Tautonia sociabilis]|uniref:Uncharacterized protein n=1 Tax=Tautonia sociabilis TaxID=2080755 RepID=A0A432MMS4_9BACT|nr:hypothetical protein [Tautonia sociabilis]RUL88395.1 hypothetical protein TsocGM_07680 [Tautonia sociabilis]